MISLASEDPEATKTISETKLPANSQYPAILLLTNADNTASNVDAGPSNIIAHEARGSPLLKTKIACAANHRCQRPTSIPAPSTALSGIDRSPSPGLWSLSRIRFRHTNAPKVHRDAEARNTLCTVRRGLHILETRAHALVARR